MARKQRAIALVTAMIIALVAAVGYIGYQRMIVANSDYSGDGNGNTVMIKVAQGDSVSSLAPELVDKDVVASRRALFNAVEKRGGQVDLQPGYYALSEEMSGDSALAELTSSDAQRGVIDIPTGSTLDDVKVVGGESRPGIYTLISRATCKKGDQQCLSAEELADAAANSTVTDLKVPKWAHKPVAAHANESRRIEGLIAPGVHLFDPTAPAQQILATLISESAQEYEGTGLLQAADKQKMSPYDLLTAASLLERESHSDDFVKVARVILNRLEQDKPLQFDSTVNYGLDEQEVATSDADRNTETPWNTYAKKGLPETPISSPSLAALHAMEDPAPGDWLYFVTVDMNGTTVFNSDFAAHEAAINEARRNGVLDSAK